MYCNLADKKNLFYNIVVITYFICKYTTYDHNSYLLAVFIYSRL